MFKTLAYTALTVALCLPMSVHAQGKGNRGRSSSGDELLKGERRATTTGNKMEKGDRRRGGSEPLPKQNAQKSAR
jgi:hypothetical protein